MKTKSTKTIHCTEDGIEIFYDNKDQGVNVMYEDSGLQNLQLYGNKLNDVSYQSRTSTMFNEVQNKMYRRIVYGVEALNKAELTTMSKNEISKIQKDYSRAQVILNRYKNQVMNQSLNGFLEKHFWNSPIAREMIDFSDDPDTVHEENTLSFKELGINKKQVAGKLIEHGFLPVDFFYLSA